MSEKMKTTAASTHPQTPSIKLSVPIFIIDIATAVPVGGNMWKISYIRDVATITNENTTTTMIVDRPGCVVAVAAGFRSWMF